MLLINNKIDIFKMNKYFNIKDNKMSKFASFESLEKKICNFEA